MNAGGVDKACKSNATPPSFCYNINMYYVYIIKSRKDSRMYTGYSSDLRQRVAEHNSGKSSYTRNFRPWKLIYYEAFLSEKDAKLREKNLKVIPNASTQLKKRLGNSINEG
jgi:putative endonuclease